MVCEAENEGALGEVSTELGWSHTALALDCRESDPGRPWLRLYPLHEIESPAALSAGVLQGVVGFVVGEVTSDGERPHRAVVLLLRP